MTLPRKPHLLVSIDRNVGEWRDAVASSLDRPRLPLPYALGAAAINAGFTLSAIERSAGAERPDPQPSDTTPFDTVYPARRLARALRETDLAILWGRQGLAAIGIQAMLPRPRRRLLLFSYVWGPAGKSSLRRRSQFRMVRATARFSRGVVLMTEEQVELARAMLPASAPVIKLQVGIDCGFYSRPAVLADMDEVDRRRVERLLQSPYVIMPGDELRLNDDALAIVETSPLNLVRVSQYGHKNGMAELKVEISRRNLGDRLVVFERITYPALRFLLRHAVAYAGLVDATWQPAGWTVACESLASGLPVVLYEGLTSRELSRLGASRNVLRSVSMGDIRAFSAELQSLAATHDRNDVANEAQRFAEKTLGMETTGAAFGERLAQVVPTR